VEFERFPYSGQVLEKIDAEIADAGFGAYVVFIGYEMELGNETILALSETIEFIGTASDRFQIVFGETEIFGGNVAEDMLGYHWKPLDIVDEKSV
jgi:hypothetical protein